MPAPPSVLDRALTRQEVQRGRQKRKGFPARAGMDRNSPAA